MILLVDWSYIFFIYESNSVKDFGNLKIEKCRFGVEGIIVFNKLFVIKVIICISFYFIVEN